MLHRHSDSRCAFTSMAAVDQSRATCDSSFDSFLSLCRRIRFFLSVLFLSKEDVVFVLRRLGDTLSRESAQEKEREKLKLYYFPLLPIIRVNAFLINTLESCFCRCPQVMPFVFFFDFSLCAVCFHCSLVEFIYRPGLSIGAISSFLSVPPSAVSLDVVLIAVCRR